MDANDEFLVKVADLKGLLASRATNGTPSEEEYGNLRAELVKIEPIRQLLPRFVLTCRTIREFWAFLKPKFSTHNERLAFLQSEFDPILAALEQRVTPRAPGNTYLAAPKPDLVLVTVNEHETQAVHDAFQKATGSEGAPVPLEGRLYHSLGTLNGATVYHAISEIGSGGPGAMQQAVDKAIRALDPGAVIAVGIAFGVSGSDQSIGDVLLSKQLRLYDLQRAGAEIVLRGDKPHASSWLINYFDSFRQVKWKGARVWPGVILSGERLIDNIDYRDQLLKFEKDAVGGEMEGAGLYVSSHDHKVDWIVIKAICDWADGNKKSNKTQRQKKAAENAAEFVVEALKYAPWKRPR
jgi:nucleoside phosphorylase